MISSFWRRKKYLQPTLIWYFIEWSSEYSHSCEAWPCGCGSNFDTERGTSGHNHQCKFLFFLKQNYSDQGYYSKNKRKIKKVLWLEVALFFLFVKGYPFVTWKLARAYFPFSPLTVSILSVSYLLFYPVHIAKFMSSGDGNKHFGIKSFSYHFWFL